MSEHMLLKRGDRIIFYQMPPPQVRFKILGPTGAGYAVRDPRDGKEFYIGRDVIDGFCKLLVREEGRG